MKTILAVGLLFLATAANAAPSTFMVPRLERTAQGATLGDAGVYLSGLNAIGVNPAGIHVSRPNILLQYQQFPLQTSLSLFAVAYPAAALKTTFAFSYLSLQSLGFDRIDELGRELGSFRTQDQIFSFHASRPFNFGALFGLEDLSPLSLGLSAKIILSSIDSYSASAYAGDFGLRYSLKSIPVTWGFAALNIGRGPAFLSERASLPSSLVFSAAWHPDANAVITGSFSHYPNDRQNEFSGGAQLGLGEALFLRARYALVQGDRKPGAGWQNLAAGFGVKFSHHSLDYAFQPFSSALREAQAMGTHRLTLTLRWGDAGIKDRKPNRAKHQAAEYPQNPPSRKIRAH